MSLSVLITNITLGGRTGTEIVVRDLALGLGRAGHRPMVYSPRPGPIATEIAAAGVPVIDDIAALPAAPDVIHGHHVIQTGIACARFPAAPCVFVCHDAAAWHDAAPRLPNVRAWAVVNETFRARLAADAGIDPDRIALVPNGVDTDRFVPGPPLPRRPRRALAFAKNSGHLAAVREACAARGIALDVVGAAVGRVEAAPESLLNDYDLVFASALTAIEAMACERAVIVCDGRGLAGFARPTVYTAWRRLNFGLGAFTRPLTARAVGAEIDRYDPASAAAVGERLRQEAGLTGWTAAWVALYGRLLAAPIPATSDPAAAWAEHLQRWDPARMPAPWLAERAALVETVARLDSGLIPLEVGRTIPADDAGRIALAGFHPAEPWGVWSARRQASIRFRIAGDAPPPGRIRLRLAAFAVPGREAFAVRLRINGRPLGELALTGDTTDAVFALDLHPDETAVWITAETDPCVSPAEAGASADPRPLGFALNEIEIA